MNKYRIIERKYSAGNTEYEVQKYSRKWYSRKYKWKTVKTPFYSGDGQICIKEPAIFKSEIEAKRFIEQETNSVIKERILVEYYGNKR